MELREALSQVDAIKTQIARVELYRGYRSLTVGITGLLAFVAATVQAIWLPHPARNVDRYVDLWVAVAMAGVVIVGVDLLLRCLRQRSSLVTRGTISAIEQFLPCLVAGALVTWAMTYHARDSLALLPGLWAILFGLGMLASARYLPTAIFWVGTYYLAAGTACLVWAQGNAAFSPWAMAGTFGVGQLATAAVLYLKLERNNEPC